MVSRELNKISPLPSRKTISKVTVAELSDRHKKLRTLRHSTTNCLFGAVPVTSQNTFSCVPFTGNRSIQKGATSVVGRCTKLRNPLGVSRTLLYPAYASVKLIVPLLLTNIFEKFPPPNSIGKGGLTAATESSPRFRFVPVMVV